MQTIDESLFMDDMDYQRFEYCSTPEQDECDINDETTKELITDLRKTQTGYIVNSSVYIPNDNWHTLIVMGNVRRVFCALCDIYINTENRVRHTATERHQSGLEGNRPLRDFELSITRKLSNGYHCGVCNVTFEDADQHADSKTHSEQLLFSINKAYDLLYDNEVKEVKKMVLPDTNPYYVYNNNDNNDNYEYPSLDKSSEVEGSMKSDTGNDVTKWDAIVSYAQIAKTEADIAPKEYKIKLSDRLITVKFDSWNMIVYTSKSSFYCMACKFSDVRRLRVEHCATEQHLMKLKTCTIVRGYETHLVRRVSDNLFHCGHCNNLQAVDEMGIHLEQKHPRNNIKIDRAKLEKEQFEATKNIVNENIQKFNQGVQMLNGNAQIFNRQATTPKKLNKMQMSNGNLKNQTITPKKLFNDVQMLNQDVQMLNGDAQMLNRDMNSNDLPNNYYKENNESYTVLVDNGRQYNLIFDTTPTIKTNITNEVTNETKPVTFRGSIMKISLFGFHIYVNIESYNTICRVKDAQTCLACDMTVNDVPGHIIQNLHIEMLQRMFFIPEFTCHLVRALRTNLHCVICNTMLANDRPVLNSHINTYEHRLLLKKALFLREPLSGFDDPGFGVLEDKEAGPPIDLSTELAESNADTGNIDNSQNIDIDKNIDADNYNRQLDYRNLIIKLRNIYLIIREDAWHTIFFKGDGTSYCFCCDVKMLNLDVFKHLSLKSHWRRLAETKVLDMYGNNLLRQNENMYHCAMCNVVVSRGLLEKHLSWPQHEAYAAAALAHDRRALDDARITGLPEITAELQTEKYKGITDNAKSNIIYNVKITKRNSDKKLESKRSKIVIFDDNVYKIDFDHWNGFIDNKDKFKCILCNANFKKSGLESHYCSQLHLDNLGRRFYKVSDYGLARELSDNRIHCVICNIALSKSDNIQEHVKGKKHAKNFESIKSDGCRSDVYDGCDDEPFIV